MREDDRTTLLLFVIFGAFIILAFAAGFYIQDSDSGDERTDLEGVTKDGNTYRVDEPWKTLKVSTYWMMDRVEANYTIYDQDFQKVQEGQTSNIRAELTDNGSLEIEGQEINNSVETLYIKLHYIAKFQRGGIEHKYNWVAVPVEHWQDNEVSIQITYEPREWRENPSLFVKPEDRSSYHN